MAGILRWTGAVGDFDPDTSGNWATVSGTPASIPGDGDGVLFDHRSNSDIRGAATAATLTQFVVTSGCRINIGEVGTPLSGYAITSGDAIFSYSGRGDFCNFSGNNDLVVVNSTNSGRLTFSGGTCTKAVTSSGEVVFGTSAELTEICNVGANVILNENGTAVTTAICANGSITTRRNMTNAEIGAIYGRGQGRMIFKETAAIGTSLKVIGGVAHWLSGGTVAYLNGVAGAFLTRDNPFPSATVTVSERNQTAFTLQRQWEGGALALSDDTTYGAGSEGGSGGSDHLGVVL